MNDNASRPPIRFWPGILIVLLQYVTIFGSGIIAPATTIQMYALMGTPLLGGLALLIWWLFFSRARWSERLAGAAIFLLSIVVTFPLLHDRMAMTMFIWGIPVVGTAFAVAVALRRSSTTATRLKWVTVSVLAACAVFLLLRSEGVRGDGAGDFAFRFSATPEDRFLASVENDPEIGTSALVESSVEEDATDWPAPAWPGFRGPRRDGVLPGVRVATDWAGNPPAELWRRPVGPGWSSFAVDGGRLFTMEQRGEDEIVACYGASTGDPIWIHRDETRFWEAIGGPGPRSTPTLYEGRVYTLGATGILNALDAATGATRWSRNAAEDTGAPVPMWGFAASPLIVDDLVIVHTGAPDGKAVVAYDLASGDPRWFAPAGPLSYSSAHFAVIEDTPQVIILTGDGATGLVPATGDVLWKHEWPMGQGARIVQPGFTEDGDMLIGTGFGIGVRRVRITESAGAWNTSEQWTSSRLNPYFNDFVVHRGHAYGFDGAIMTCLKLEDGTRAWKGGRYGHGQALLLPDQDLLVVLAEDGDLALVEAKPDAYSGVARVPGIKGKTWNHPVLVDGVLYVRNDEEMAAFRIGDSTDVAGR